MFHCHEGTLPADRLLNFAPQLRDPSSVHKFDEKSEESYYDEEE